MKVGLALRKHRQSQGITLEDLARRSGYTKGYISLVESDQRLPSLTALARLSRPLGLTPAHILISAQAGQNEN